MIRYEYQPENNYLEFSIKGKIAKKDFEGLAKDLGPIFDEMNEIRVMEVIEDFKGMEASALWEDIKFGFQHLGIIRKMKKVALVVNETWIETLMKLMTPIIPGEVKIFKPEEMAAARAWALS